ncbi:hypothetical protein JCM1840_004316 [Sporobolomyces johnsonii]
MASKRKATAEPKIASKRGRKAASSPVEKIKPDPEDEDIEHLDENGMEQHEYGTLPHEMDSTPLAKLYEAMRELAEAKLEDEKPSHDGLVVYWMRNHDLRLTDNTALSHASALAHSLNLPLLVLHVFSPGDYQSHDRSPRRIDFQLRQLAYLRDKLHKLDIPLFTFSHDKRKEIPAVLCGKLEEWGAVGVYANVEYEVDELRRDTEILRRTKEGRKSGQGFRGKAEFFKDVCVVAPGELLTNQGKPYAVFSPWQRKWADVVNSNLLDYIGENNGPVIANDKSARSHAVLEPMFSHELPTSISGFELDKDESELMKKLWPVGEGIVDQVMHRFLKTKLREQVFFEPPLHPGAEEVDDPKKESKIGEYTTGRNRVDLDGTSHISPYLAAGLISARQCLRQVYELSGSRELPAGRDTGPGMWVQEVGWRDFYQHVLAAWPRVCMNKPFNLKYEHIAWEEDNDDKLFEAWKAGQTGYPIVDAAMRSLKTQSYMHNRCRMIVAMFLTKDLLLDWRKGERWFMQNLIDGDLASNSGGWQWSASTGVDPQPYFRVFNPISQSEKVDPSGDYIRHWVPELRSLKGKAIHDPSSRLSPAEIKKLGYVPAIVDHAKARVKAIETYKKCDFSPLLDWRHPANTTRN